MNTFEIIKTANKNLWRHKLRTFLTVSAIFVGAFTLTMTNGLGDGLRDYIENQVKNIEGNNVLFVRKKFETENKDAPKTDAPAEYKETVQDEAGNLIDPNTVLATLPQMEALTKEIPEIKTITPSYRIDGEYITLDGSKKYQLELGMLSEGVTQKAEAGKTIDGENQIMLPLSLARAFDENIKNLVGKTATIAYKVGQNGEIKTQNLQIVGVATKGFMSNYNSFVDAKTARAIYEDQSRNNQFFNQFGSFTFLLTTGEAKRVGEIKKTLDAKGFSAETIADQKKRTYDGIAIFQVGMNLFALVALLAASFGVINTLIIAVLERTKEIGLQKALGMSRGKVFLLFTLEAVLIGFWGAVLGIAAAFGVGQLVNFYAARELFSSFEGFQLLIFLPQSILIVVALVCGITFVSGVLPALRASRLNPIEALRYE
ncbi:MAG TPA: ABC transporter permease [Pyrinomonadaceae bacterium]